MDQPFSKQQLLPQEETLEILKQKGELFIGVPKENQYQEKRICLTPDAVTAITANGHRVMIESGAGEGAFYSDVEYSNAGAEISKDPKKVFGCPLILKVEPPTFAEIEMMNPQSTVISALQLKVQKKKYFEELKYYYANFYGLELERDYKDDITFYYLDLTEDSKGALSSTRRHKELSSLQTIMGIMLLNMYYDRYFENIKEITFQDIKKEILSGENSKHFKKLWFKDIRDDYSPNEWKRVIINVKNTIRDFEKLGWVESMAKDEGEDIHFKLKEPIYRFQKLYEKEIIHIDEFIENYLLQTND